MADSLPTRDLLSIPDVALRNRPMPGRSEFSPMEEKAMRDSRAPASDDKTGTWGSLNAVGRGMVRGGFTPGLRSEAP